MPLWSDLGAEDLGGGLFRIPLALPNDGLAAVNVYAICDPTGITLVDGGWAMPASERQLTSALASIDRDISEIRRVLVTHIHRDHYTQAVVLRSRFGIPISLGEGERNNLAEIMDSVRENRPIGNFSTLRRAGAADLVPAASSIHDETQGRHWAVPDQWLASGSLLELPGRQLKVVATPGHTAGHVVFVDDENGTLFAGDHVLPHITPSVGFEPSPVRWPLRDYLESLRLMLSMPDARLLPAHGMVTHSVHAQVGELLEHHKIRLDACREVVEGGATTAYAAARALPWTRRKRVFADLDLFNQILAVAETTAHFDVLVLAGRLGRYDREDGVQVYTAKQRA